MCADRWNPGTVTCDCVPVNGITDGGYKPCFIPAARAG
jgi:hypothetical protein